MGIYDEILKRLKEEITKDPTGRGYAGKTNAQIVALLNSPFDTPVTTYIGNPSPINRIMAGLSGAGNLISLTEVTAAKNLI